MKEEMETISTWLETSSGKTETVVNLNISEFVYTDGNITKMTQTYKRNDIEGEEPTVTNMKYDKMTSPFRNSTTPKWLLMDMFGFDFANQNNMTEQDDGYYKTTIEYEHDSAGFPLKAHIKRFTGGIAKESSVTTFEYKDF